MNRRSLLTGSAAAFCLAAFGGVVFSRAAWSALPKVSVWKDPSCGCCGAWVDHMIEAGFQVEVTEEQAMNAVKARNGVPPDLASCHTALVDGYVLEGHVPAADVKRLLAERPAAKGLAVPGMPQGSPGMETGEHDPYDVVLFGGTTGPTVFARHNQV